jgi:hypothetical protein
MTSFVQPHFRTTHPGVERFETAVDAAKQIRQGFDSTRSLAAMLLAAIVAAMLVVADQVVESWADGNLLFAWIMLWVVAFAALALFAGTARGLASRAVAALDTWSQRAAQARADERLWAIAQTDPRVMADLRSAFTRHEVDAPATPAPVLQVDASEMPFVAIVPAARKYHPYY